MTLLSYQPRRMPACENMKGGGVAMLRQTMRETDTEMHWKANCARGMVQRTIWLHGMPFVVPLVSSRFSKRVSNARKYGPITRNSKHSC